MKLPHTKKLVRLGFTLIELLVVITPRFVKPFAAAETAPLPNFPREFLDGGRPGQAAPAAPPAPPKFSGPRGQQSSGGPP